MGIPNAPGVGSRIAGTLSRIRERGPLVHCLTNFVTMTDVANALLALGAQPIMALAPEEVAEVAGRADALVLNLGTPTRERIDAMLAAARAARDRARPVVFDPVRVDATSFRMAAARRLLDEAHPTLVRGNTAEIVTLAAGPGQLLGKLGVEAGTNAARALARQRQLVVAATGARDIVSDGVRTLAVDHGHPLLAVITGAGDMVTAIVAAFAAVEPDRVLAAAGALVVFGLAAERASASSPGPGGFHSALFDALYGLSPEEVAGRASVFPV